MDGSTVSDSSCRGPGRPRRALLHALVGLGALALLCGCDSGSTPSASVTVASAKLPAAQPVRFVKLEELTEWNGKEWASVAEFNLIDSTGGTIDRSGWKASADSAGEHDPPYNAIDGLPATLWNTQWEVTPPGPPHALMIDMGRPHKVAGFRYLPRQDKTINGTIAKYRFYVSTDGTSWGTPVSEGDFSNMSGPRIEKIVIFAEQVENHPPVAATPKAQKSEMGHGVSLEISATDADDDVLAYSAKGLPPGLKISPATGLITGTPITPGNYSVTASVSDNKAPNVNVTFHWTVQPPQTSSEAVKPGEVRFAKLEEVSEINGNPWASMAEFNLVGADGANLSRKEWTVSADSFDTSDRPENAIDGNPSSIWHSQWSGGAAPPPPHSFIVDLGHATLVRGFRYLPRQDKLMNGRFAKFRFYTSLDGVDWGRPLAKGDFTADGEPDAEKTVMLK